MKNKREISMTEKFLDKFIFSFGVIFLPQGLGNYRGLFSDFLKMVTQIMVESFIHFESNKFKRVLKRKIYYRYFASICSKITIKKE